jgi:hypothetical protein
VTVVGPARTTVEWSGVEWRGEGRVQSVQSSYRPEKNLTRVKSMFFICQYNIYNFKFEHINNLF